MMDESDKEIFRRGLKAANYSDEQIESIIAKQEHLKRNVKYGDNV